MLSQLVAAYTSMHTATTIQCRISLHTLAAPSARHIDAQSIDISKFLLENGVSTFSAPWFIRQNMMQMSIK